MTREEREDAIDIIQSILDKYEEDECLVTEITIGDEDIKAFKMAIEALENDPKIVPIAKIRFDEDKLKELVNKAVLTVTPQVPRLIPVGESFNNMTSDCTEEEEEEQEDGNIDG